MWNASSKLNPILEQNHFFKEHKTTNINYFGLFIPLPYVKRGQSNTLTSATHAHNS